MPHAYRVLHGLGLLLLASACGQKSSEPGASIAPEPHDRLDAGTTEPDAAPPGVPDVPVAVCSPDGWCWDTAGPQGNTLNAVAANGEHDVWAVGDLGITLHFDGEHWAAEWAPARVALRGVWVSGSEVWAVGDDATVLHHVGAAWESIAVPELGAEVDLRAVSGDAAGNVWIVGASGTLFERRASNWARVDVGVAGALNAVWSSADEVWVVGEAGMVLHHAGEGEWQHVDVGTSQNLTAVHGRAREVWIAGAAGELRYFDAEAEKWKRATGEGPAPQGDLGSVQVTAGEQIYVAGSRGDVYHWDGTATCPVPGDAGAPEQPCPHWGALRSSGQSTPILGLWASGDRAIGVGPYGSILHWDGAARSIWSEASLDSYLDVSGTSAEHVWIGGDRLLQRRPGGWEELARDSARPVYALAVASSGSALVAGTGGMARAYANEKWLDMDVRADAWLRGLWSDGATGWLVGNRGSAWGLLNQRLWTRLETPTDHDLLAVWSSASGVAWAVGTGGVTLRHDGVLWAAIPTGPDGGLKVDLRGVWGSAEDDIWAVGTGGAAVHWDGSLWTQVTPDADFALNDVWGRSRKDVWAVGSQGTILHYDGESWQPEFSGTEHALNAIWGSADRLFAVGDHGTILVKPLNE